MVIDCSNKRRSLIIAGILAITILSVLAVFILGLGVKDTINQDVNDFSFENTTKEEKMKPGNIGNIDTVLVAHCCDWDDFDTEKGHIKITDGYIDSVLPLCINDNTIDWWIELEVYGGYTFVEGVIDFYQKGQWVGYIEIVLRSSSNIPYMPCCYQEVVLESYVDCHSFCLDSNQYPDIINDCGLCTMNIPEFCTFEGGIPGKDVDLKFNTTWQGCECEDQSFEIILAQKDNISESPTPE